MPAAINYKKKYLELRTKYIADLDMAFRLGCEQGAQQAQQQQAIEAEAKAQEMQLQQQQIQAQGQGGAGAGAEGSPEQPGGGEGGGEAPAAPEAPGAPDMEAQGSEMDQHINKLQSMLGSNPNPEMKKSLDALQDLRKSIKFAADLKKSQAAISGIAKALHKPAFKLNAQATHNMNDNAKKALSLQHKIVADVMKSWQKEEEKAGSDIKNILNLEGVLGE